MLLTSVSFLESYFCKQKCYSPFGKRSKSILILLKQNAFISVGSFFASLDPFASRSADIRPLSLILSEFFFEFYFLKKKVAKKDRLLGQMKVRSSPSFASASWRASLSCHSRGSFFTSFVPSIHTLLWSGTSSLPFGWKDSFRIGQSLTPHSQGPWTPFVHYGNKFPSFTHFVHSPCSFVVRSMAPKNE